MLSKLCAIRDTAEERYVTSSQNHQVIARFWKCQCTSSCTKRAELLLFGLWVHVFVHGMVSWRHFLVWLFLPITTVYGATVIYKVESSVVLGCAKKQPLACLVACDFTASLCRPAPHTTRRSPGKPGKHWLLRPLFSLDPFLIRQLRLCQMLDGRRFRMNGDLWPPQFCLSGHYCGSLFSRLSGKEFGLFD